MRTQQNYLVLLRSRLFAPPPLFSVLAAARGSNDTKKDTSKGGGAAAAPGEQTAPGVGVLPFLQRRIRLFKNFIRSFKGIYSGALNGAAKCREQTASAEATPHASRSLPGRGGRGEGRSPRPEPAKRAKAKKGAPEGAPRDLSRLACIIIAHNALKVNNDFAPIPGRGGGATQTRAKSRPLAGRASPRQPQRPDAARRRVVRAAPGGTPGTTNPPRGLDPRGEGRRRPERGGRRGRAERRKGDPPQGSPQTPAARHLDPYAGGAARSTR